MSVEGDARPPVVPNGFRLVRELGRGGMGEVWLAVRESDGATVALKILVSLESESARRLFEREAVACLNLRHPHIVRGISLGEERGVPWLAMEYVAGGSLGDRVRSEGPLPAAEAVRVAIETAKGLKEAARAGIVHRDVKPANLLFTEAGAVKVADLGLVAAVSDGTARERHGTPAFMSPELVRGRSDVDLRADIYSLGLTLYFALTGRRPFPERSRRGLLRAQLHTVLPDPRDVQPSIPEGLVLVLRKMTAKDPEERYRLWDELLIDLAQVARGESPLGAAISALERIRPGRKRLLAAAAGAVLLGAFLLVLFRGGPSPAPADPPDPAEAAARAELDYALRILAEKPDDGERALSELRAIARRHPGTAAGAEAGRRAKSVRERLRESERARVEEVRGAVEALLRRNGFDEAGREVDAARRTLSSDAAPALAALADEVETAARTAREELESAVEAALEAGDLDAARAALDAAPVSTTARITERVAELRLILHRRRDEREEARRERIESAYGTALVHALAFAAAGLAQEARAALAAASGEGTEDALGDRPGLDAEILRDVEAALAAAIAGAGAKKGESAVLAVDTPRGPEIVVGEIAGAEGEGVLLEGREEPVPVTALDGPSLDFLAGGLAAAEAASHALARREMDRVLDRVPRGNSPLAIRIKALAADLPAREPPAVDPRIPPVGGDAAAARGLRSRALDAFALGRLALAVTLYREAVEADGRDAESRLGLALAYSEFLPKNPSPALRAVIVAELVAVRRLDPALAETNHVAERLKNLGVR